MTAEFVELPAPTAWPMVAALGITLGFAGLVINGIVTVVGVVLTIAGAVGWFRDVLPVEDVERIPLRPPARRARPVQPAPRAVAHLVAGQAGHRVRIPAEIHPYSAGVWGGLAGGAAMAALAVLYGLVAYGSIWYPINLLAAVAMPALAHADAAAAAGVQRRGAGRGGRRPSRHLALRRPGLRRHAADVPAPSGAAGGAWSRRWCGPGCCGRRSASSTRRSTRASTGRGSSPRRSPSASPAGSVIARTERIATMQSWPLAARAGIEAPGVSPEKERDA